MPVSSVAVEKPYASLSLPMGSESSIPVALQEENGRSFLKNVEGVSISIENSHPQYVKASLDFFNSTLTLLAQNIGEANVVVKHGTDSFDVIRVRVVSSIKPHSPVHVHLGANIQFMYEEGSANAHWESDNTKILSIDSSGNARALSEGTATVSYKGDVTLQSVVHISKIDHIELDSETRPEFFTNVQSNSHYQDEYLIPVTLSLAESLEEITPEVFSQGKSLIKHNVKVKCEVDEKDFAIAFSKQQNNRFFCVLKPLRAPSTLQSPGAIELTVSTSADLASSY
jgi:hypothetical protein